MKTPRQYPTYIVITINSQGFLFLHIFQQKVREYSRIQCGPRSFLLPIYIVICKLFFCQEKYQRYINKKTLFFPLMDTKCELLTYWAGLSKMMPFVQVTCVFVQLSFYVWRHFNYSFIFV